MFQIETKLDPIEIDGTKIAGLPNEADQLIVRGHWNWRDFAILDWRGHSITISIEDLRRALTNAENHR